MEMMMVTLLVAVTATNEAMATMVNNGNVAAIIATAMANSAGVVSGGAINDFGYGTKFGTQPGKVIML